MRAQPQHLFINQAFCPSPDEQLGDLFKVWNFRFCDICIEPDLTMDNIVQCFQTDGKLVVHYALMEAWGWNSDQCAEMQSKIYKRECINSGNSYRIDRARDPDQQVCTRRDWSQTFGGRANLAEDRNRQAHCVRGVCWDEICRWSIEKTTDHLEWCRIALRFHSKCFLSSRNYSFE